jgi:uncharacterized repeat protein (TIGR02543 family)
LITVCFDSQGGTEVAPEKVNQNQTVALKIPIKEGYTFDGWYTGLTVNDSKFTLNTPVSHNITLYAKWTANQYSIDFDTLGGDVVNTITQGYNTLVSKPNDPAKEGYTFDGWYSDVNRTVKYSFTTMPAEHITLYAKWNVNQYTITFDTDGGDIVGSVTQDYNTPVLKPDDPTKEGCTFAGWYVDENKTQGYTFSKMPSQNIILYAKWNTIEGTQGLKYTLLGPSYSVSLGTAADQEMIIPEYYNGLPVTEIGSYGFRNDTDLFSVIIPNTVTSIGFGAFTGCTNMVSITLPFAGASLENSQFGYIFGASESLDNLAFVPSSLKNVTITGGYSIGNKAFWNCLIETIIISDTITNISSYAFYYCVNLKNVIMPDTITSIGSWAFYHCVSIEEITFPKQLTRIGSYTFAECNGLSNIVIPDNVDYIGRNAFGSCENLLSVYIPESVETIENYTFYDCLKATIYCEAQSKPFGWESEWNDGGPAVWGYQRI